jgi:hypothetical protein
LIIPKGTQIVLLNETKVLNENRFYAKGTIGKIVALPSDAFHAYQVEFPTAVTEWQTAEIFRFARNFKLSKAD